MREEEKLKNGTLFFPGDPELREMKRRTHNLNLEYNALSEDESEKRKAILDKIVGEIGENGFMQGPIFFHYGCHTKIGRNFFANFNLTVQDDAEVTIGDNCNFGPNVTIVTPVHPMLPDERNAMMCGDGKIRRLCYAKPVHIGSNCWFGANVVVCSGASVGSNCVIGAGSVIVKDIPDGSFAAGNPCRVIRQITDKDSMKYKPEILGDCRVIE